MTKIRFFVILTCKTVLYQEEKMDELKRKLGEELYGRLVYPANFEYVRRFAELCLSRDTIKVDTGERLYELLPFVHHGESITGAMMIKKAVDKFANLGVEDGMRLFTHWYKNPDSFPDGVVVVFTEWKRNEAPAEAVKSVYRNIAIGIIELCWVDVLSGKFGSQYLLPRCIGR